ncbi:MULTISPECIES: ABC transporter permease [Nocardia]|uniref:ABC transporter permease n=1 Tax=Nocardia implantans TaxID=3108168 RepID=A0ABU6AXM5_9NOCA|nr:MULTISPECIES: ABC transporter permease [unclassified Nocardia]MBF6190711.1 ABC transporter permease [Nocardia beijingensis]MEA3528623.1 ABC transporter permease [Nocardia sp. CDC192]MEB3512225.1 ABC transporter permease [Nocardia sp. CDC186]
MFVALRDLRAARGRFALITLVVTLVAVLVSFLSGLTAGLAHQNVSAVESMPGDTVVFADTGGAPSFDGSVLTEDQLAAWRAAADGVTPVGIARGKAAGDGRAPAQVALFGTDTAFGDHSATEAGTVLLSTGAAAGLGAVPGDSVAIGGRAFTVSAVRGDDWYSHTPVVWMTLADWQALNPRSGAATVLAVSGATDPDAVNATAHTRTTDVPGARSAIGSYRAENGSLTMMTVLLFAVSALVIGAFFTVWTIQRMPDIAILKALGATSGSLVRDALGQAAIVLAAGIATGLGITTATAALLGDAVPFVLSPATTLLPSAALILLGLLGAAFALRFVFTADPLTALGVNR